jgi:DNA gyrase subunit B
MRKFILENGVSRIRMGSGNGNAITGNRLATLIQRAMRLDTILQKFDKEEKIRDVCTCWRRIPPSRPADFGSQLAIETVGKRVARLLGEQVVNVSRTSTSNTAGYNLVFTIRRDGLELNTHHRRGHLRFSQVHRGEENLLSQLKALGEPLLR